MTDIAATAEVIKGRSLWADAWGRLKTNRAAIASAIYLAIIVILCVFGPYFTGHEFSTIYQSYVRVPPSLTPYPKSDDFGGEIDSIIKRAHLNLKDWKDEGGRIYVTVTSAKPIDERVT